MKDLYIRLILEIKSLKKTKLIISKKYKLYLIRDPIQCMHSVPHQFD